MVLLWIKPANMNAIPGIRARISPGFLSTIQAWHLGVCTARYVSPEAGCQLIRISGRRASWTLREWCSMRCQCFSAPEYGTAECQRHSLARSMQTVGNRPAPTPRQRRASSVDRRQLALEVHPQHSLLRDPRQSHFRILTVLPDVPSSPDTYVYTLKPPAHELPTF